MCSYYRATALWFREVIMPTQKGLVVMLCLATLPLFAQEQDTTQSSSSITPAAPVSLPLFSQPSLAFSSELEHSNYLSGGVSVGMTFDDNALNTTSDRMSNFALSVLPFIALEQSRSRLRWKFNYAGGFTFNQRLSARNQGSHDLGFEGEYRLSPHVSLLLRDHFLMTTGVYNQLNQNFNSPSGSVLQRPNQFVITPLAKQIGNTATAQLNYQFGRDSQVGASGSFNLLHYRDVPAGFSLVDSQSVEGEAFYSHRVVSQNWMGVTYRYQKLTFSPLANSTLVQSILVTDTFYLSPNMSLTLFAGPQHLDGTTNIIFPTVILPSVNVRAIPISQKSWSWSTGGSYNWNGKRTSFVAAGSRMVSDGGGLMGTVQLISANAAVRRQWTHSFSSQLGVMYGDSHALNVFASQVSSLKMISGDISISRSLSEHLLLTLGYARDLQQQYQGALRPGNINHNRGWVSLSYNFQRPVGR
jgi:hypothetical protein